MPLIVTAVDRSEKGDSAERLVVFTDAVVAIALTLLVLPLVDSSGQAPVGASGSERRHTGDHERSAGGAQAA